MLKERIMQTKKMESSLGGAMTKWPVLKQILYETCKQKDVACI